MDVVSVLSLIHEHLCVRTCTLCCAHMPTHIRIYAHAHIHGRHGSTCVFMKTKDFNNPSVTHRGRSQWHQSGSYKVCISSESLKKNNLMCAIWANLAMRSLCPCVSPDVHPQACKIDIVLVWLRVLRVRVDPDAINVMHFFIFSHPCRITSLDLNIWWWMRH